MYIYACFFDEGTVTASRLPPEKEPSTTVDRVMSRGIEEDDDKKKAGMSLKLTLNKRDREPKEGDGRDCGFLSPF